MVVGAPGSVEVVVAIGVVDTVVGMVHKLVSQMKGRLL